MFLKSLVLKGFKSFAEKTELVFEPGVTVIVGPNGSGKSNLVDAVAWVLGAQGPRTLRGGKMDDVIFAGTSKRPALGRAEVSLTIDNALGVLPIDFTEVTITRTLFRNGDSEYQINGAPCRLLDVQELLSDSGIGREQHVIVGQGQLDTILNASPEQRRAVIEEAAGVLKYRRRKERAERRLVASEGNLLRLGDLLREAKRQLAPLERQAEAARRHDSVVEELRAIKLHLAGHQIAGYQTRLERLRDENSEYERHEIELRDRLRALDVSVLDVEQSLTVLGEEGLADWMVRIEALRERSRGLSALVEEKRRGVTRDLEAAADEGVVGTLIADAVALRDELSGLPTSFTDSSLPGTRVVIDSQSAQDALVQAESDWRSSEGEAARARARSDALEQQLRIASDDDSAAALSGIDGVVGPLMEYLQIEEGAEAAVACALGDALRATVVQKGQPARRAIEAMRQGLARGLVLVIDSSSTTPFPAISVPAGARSLTEVVHSSVPGIDETLARLLSQTILVADWRIALDVVSENPDLVAVTPDGDRLGGVGVWNVGGAQATAVTRAMVQDASQLAVAAEVSRVEASRAVENARAILTASRSAEVQQVAAQERRSVLQDRLDDVEARLAARDPGQQAEAEHRRRVILERDTTLGTIIDRLSNHSQAVERLHERLRSRRQRETETARASTDQLEGLRKERTQLERELLEVRERVTQAGVADAESRIKLENAVELLRAEFDVEAAVALDAPAPSVPEGTTLAGRARELERDVRLMGPINPLALAEYGSLGERVEFLQSQIEDVRSSRRELNQVIRMVNDEIVSVFQQAFEDVAEHFKTTFSILFPGGTGKLSLIDPDDLLNTGIEIDARPSGKNVRRLSLLSGGERSLTALAFLFSVFRARPSPFYLLDEVEAALDDVNLHRFLDLVQEFREEAQLVIVTHQKRTMEAGTVLYGVSMAPGDSTRIVSQRISDVVSS